MVQTLGIKKSKPGPVNYFRRVMHNVENIVLTAKYQRCNSILNNELEQEISLFLFEFT